MRAAVDSAFPASAITSSVAGSFFSSTSNDVVTAAANVLTLNSWVPASTSNNNNNCNQQGEGVEEEQQQQPQQQHVLKARFQVSLPGRIIAVDKLKIPGAAATFPESCGQHLLVALYSETQLAVMRWSNAEHTFRNVALFALSVAEASAVAATADASGGGAGGGASAVVPVVEGISSERSVGLPPLLRIDVEHGLILVLAQRRYLHLVQLSKQIVVTAPTAAAQSKGSQQKTAAAPVVKTTAAAAAAVWADEDDDDNNNNNNNHEARANNNGNKPQDGEQRDGAEEEEEGDDDEAVEEAFFESRVNFPAQPRTVDLLAYIKSARNIRDVQFVSGFDEPTIAVLKEGQCTWAGRVRLMTAGAAVVRSLSCGVIIATLNNIKTSNSNAPGGGMAMMMMMAENPFIVVREQDGLPYSTTQMAPVPSSLGGVLCFSSNSVIHVAHRGTPYAAMLNMTAQSEKQADHNNSIRWANMEWGEIDAASSAAALVVGADGTTGQQEEQQPRRRLDRTFADVCVAAISEKSFFVSHGDGACDIVELGSSNDRDVSTMRCAPVSSFDGAASVIVSLQQQQKQQQQQQYLFFGSRVHDSFVVAIERRGGVASAVRYRCSIAAALRGFAPVVDADVADIDTKDLALASEISRHAREIAARAAANGPTSSASSLEHEQQPQAVLEDPFADLIGDAPVMRAPPKSISARLRSSALITATGANRHGVINILRKHVTVEVMHRQGYDCNGVFTLRCTPPSSSSSATRGGAGQVKRERDGGGVAAVNSLQQGEAGSTTAVLLLCTSTATVVLSTLEGRLKQLTENDAGFKIKERTVAALEVGTAHFSSGAATATAAVEIKADFFLQVTAAALNIVQLKNNSTFSLLGSAAPPVSPGSWAQAVMLSPFSVLALTEEGTVHAVQIVVTGDSETTAVNIVVSPSLLLASLSSPTVDAENNNNNNNNKVTHIAALPGASAALLAKANGDLILLRFCASSDKNQAPAVLESSAIIPGFLFDFPASAITSSIKSNSSNSNNNDSSSVEASSLAEEILVARMHGHTGGVADDHFTLVIRRKTGEVSAYSVLLKKMKSGGATLWRQVSLMHDLERGATSEKLETIAEKRRKKELEEQQQKQSATTTTTTTAAEPDAQEQQQANNNPGGSLLSLSDAAARQQKQLQTRGCNRLSYFPNIGGDTDVIFIAGASSSSLLVSDRGLLRAHSIRCPEGSGNNVKHLVRCAAPINFSAIQNGIVACESMSLILGRMQGPDSVLGLDLRMPWPCRRIPLNATPHCLRFNSSNALCCAVTSAPMPFRPTQAPYDVALKSSGTYALAHVAGEIEHLPIQEDEGVPIPRQRRFRLQAFCVGNGWSLSSGGFDMLENEVVLCTENCLVNQSRGNALRPKLEAEFDAIECVVVGTSFPLGDDVPCRGRLLLFSSSLRQGERRLKLLHAENTKGPVSAIAGVGGLIVAAVGASVRIFAFDPAGGPTGNAAIVTCGFLPSATYVTCISPYKNFIAVGDIFQSVSFATLRGAGGVGVEGGAGHERAVMLAHDRFAREITATGFVAMAAPSSDSAAAVAAAGDAGAALQATAPQQSHLGILGADSRDNLFMLHYEAPATSSSAPGDSSSSAAAAAAPTGENRTAIHVTTLLTTQHFKMSGSVSRLLRIRVPNDKLSAFSGDSTSLYATLDGELGFVLPMSERDHRVLRWATTQHTAEVESVGGLNVDGERAGRISETVRLQPAQAMVDLSHVRAAFLGSSNALRKSVARRAGSTVEKILSMLSRAGDVFEEPLF